MLILSPSLLFTYPTPYPSTNPPLIRFDDGWGREHQKPPPSFGWDLKEVEKKRDRATELNADEEERQVSCSSIFPG